MAALITRTLVSVPQALEELAIVALVIAAFVALHAVLQRRFRTEVLRRHNDVAGYLFSAVGILYAVLLGFVVVVVWQKYDATVDNVQHEIDAAGDLFHVADGFSPSLRGQIRRDVAAYAHTVINVEWPAMANSATVPETGALILDDLSYRIDDFSPASQRQVNAQQAAIADSQRLFDARRQRLMRTEPAVPSILWFALVAGALSMISFCYIFGVENRPAQMLMTAILVGLIGVLFIVIYEFAGPFSGSVTISSEGWTYLAQRFAYVR